MGQIVKTPVAHAVGPVKKVSADTVLTKGERAAVGKDVYPGAVAPHRWSGHFHEVSARLPIPVTEAGENFAAKRA